MAIQAMDQNELLPCMVMHKLPSSKSHTAHWLSRRESSRSGNLRWLRPPPREYRRSAYHCFDKKRDMPIVVSESAHFQPLEEENLEAGDKTSASFSCTYDRGRDLIAGLVRRVGDQSSGLILTLR